MKKMISGVLLFCLLSIGAHAAEQQNPRQFLPADSLCYLRIDNLEDFPKMFSLQKTWRGERSGEAVGDFLLKRLKFMLGPFGEDPLVVVHNTDVLHIGVLKLQGDALEYIVIGETPNDAALQSVRRDMSARGKAKMEGGLEIIAFPLPNYPDKIQRFVTRPGTPYYFFTLGEESWATLKKSLPNGFGKESLSASAEFNAAWEQLKTTAPLQGWFSGKRYSAMIGSAASGQKSPFMVMGLDKIMESLVAESVEYLVFWHEFKPSEIMFEIRAKLKDDPALKKIFNAESKSSPLDAVPVDAPTAHAVKINSGPEAFKAFSELSDRCEKRFRGTTGFFEQDLREACQNFQGDLQKDFIENLDGEIGLFVPTNLDGDLPVETQFYKFKDPDKALKAILRFGASLTERVGRPSPIISTTYLGVEIWHPQKPGCRFAAMAYGPYVFLGANPETMKDAVTCLRYQKTAGNFSRTTAVPSLAGASPAMIFYLNPNGWLRDGLVHPIFQPHVTDTSVFATGVSFSWDKEASKGGTALIRGTLPYLHWWLFERANALLMQEENAHAAKCEERSSKILAQLEAYARKYNNRLPESFEQLAGEQGITGSGWEKRAQLYCPKYGESGPIPGYRLCPVMTANVRSDCIVMHELAPNHWYQGKWRHLVLRRDKLFYWLTTDELRKDLDMMSDRDYNLRAPKEKTAPNIVNLKGRAFSK